MNSFAVVKGHHWSRFVLNDNHKFELIPVKSVKAYLKTPIKKDGGGYSPKYCLTAGIPFHLKNCHPMISIGVTLMEG